MCRSSASSGSPPTITYRFSAIASGASNAGTSASRAPSSRRSPEDALQLLEQALVGAVRPLVRVPVELVEQAALLVAQVARDEDVDEDALVAAAEALEHRHALAAEDDDLSRSEE